MDGEEIVCTAGHPFYVLSADEKRNIVRYEGSNSNKKGKWIAAKELKISDKLLLANGKCAIIDSIEVESLESPETTYNFEVEDFHTYYVADAEILVHNSCAPETKFSKGQKALVELIKENGKNQALSMDNAKTLVKWGIEYNVNTRIDMGHSIGTAVSRAPHFHTGFNNWHIPIIK